MAALVSVEQVDQLLSKEVNLARTVRCPLHKAVGRVLREPVLADRDLPPFNRVMMDGYALRGKDLGNREFRVTGSRMAGDPAGSLATDGEGSAIEVMTGSVLPDGMDTVVPYEDTEESGEGFRICENARIEEGQFIHRKGSDYAAGTVLIEAGTRIGSVETGIAASCGCANVVISQLPRIRVFGTGDELVPVEDSPAPHQIRSSNAPSVEAALLGAGFPCGDSGHLGDDPAKDSTVLKEAIAHSDVIVISGAVSKGRRDWIPSVLDEIADCTFHGVAQRPGKPMGVWQVRQGCTIFALPGNPVSTLVGAHRHVIPWLWRRQGLAGQRNQIVSLSGPFRFDRPLTFFLPVKLDNRCHADPSPVNNSGDYAGLSGTDGFVELPASQDNWEAGAQLEFYPWSK